MTPEKARRTLARHNCPTLPPCECETCQGNRAYLDTFEKLRIAVEALECIEKKSLTTGFVYSNRGKIYQRIASKALAKIEGGNDE